MKRIKKKENYKISQLISACVHRPNNCAVSVQVITLYKSIIVGIFSYSVIIPFPPQSLSKVFIALAFLNHIFITGTTLLVIITFLGAPSL